MGCPGGSRGACVEGALDRASTFRAVRRSSAARRPMVRDPHRTSAPGPPLPLCRNICRGGSGVVRCFCRSVGVSGNGLQVQELQRICRLRRCGPSNVSPLVRGAEMRVAETRAVSRALRKAYGIGICSVEEIGSLVEAPQASGESKKLPSQPANGNYGGPKVRDRLCQIIRQHQLDPNLVKSYATDYCEVKTLREAKREQVEAFVVHLADWAEKDRNALLCQLNSYLPAKGNAA